MKYYLEEHVKSYQELVEEGKTSWDELHGTRSFEDALVRSVVEDALPHMESASIEAYALEHGCGTGPGACLLAAHGFTMDGVDLSDSAIQIAQREATKRGLAIDYHVADVLELSHYGKKYNLVVDSFCLQSLVTAADREQLFAFVQARLSKDGYYLIATAGYSATRVYGEDRFDPESGIVCSPLKAEAGNHEYAVELDGRKYLPHRRHLTLHQLSQELTQARFNVLWRRRYANAGILAVLCTSQI